VAQILERWLSVVGGTIEPDHKFPWVVNVQGTLTGKGVLITACRPPSRSSPSATARQRGAWIGRLVLRSWVA
jgi:hypothetical protein